MMKQSTQEQDQPLIHVPKRKRTICFLILYGLFVIDFISRVGINAIFPVIQADLQLTDTQVGMMGSVVLLGMAVFVLPISFLGEKYSPKKGISLSALIWSIGTLLSGMASSFGVLLASRFFVGTGNSAYAPLSNSLITSMYSKKDWGKKIGIYNTAMTFGMALGAIVFANLANQWGWRMAFYAVGFISLALTLASLTLPDPKKLMAKQCDEQDDAPVHKQIDTSLKSAFLVIGKNKSLLGVCLGAGFMSMALQGVLSWLSIYFVREMNLQLSLAATLISVLALLSAFGYPLGGTIMDKWYQYDKRARVYLPAICVSLATISFLAGFQLQLIPLIFLGGFCLTTANTAYHVATQELVPSWFKSVSYGVYVLFIQFFGACGPLLLGTLSTAFGLTKALLMIQIFTAAAVVVFLLISLVYIKDYEKARALEQEENYC